MLKYVDTDIVFQEIPGEVTLAINLSACPCRCPGCHSKHLWADTGTPLDAPTLDSLVDAHLPYITCLSLMGGDANPAEINCLLGHLRQSHPKIRTAWYSGRALLSTAIDLANLDYLKLGPYLAHLGPLNSPRTNQRMYRIIDRTLIDITHRFRRGLTAPSALRTATAKQPEAQPARVTIG